MKIQHIVLIVATAALAGCASTDGATSDQTASVQSAVYRVDGSGSSNGSLKPVVVKTADVENAVESAPGESKPRTIYWFFGGR